MGDRPIAVEPVEYNGAPAWSVMIGMDGFIVEKKDGVFTALEKDKIVTDDILASFLIDKVEEYENEEN